MLFINIVTMISVVVISPHFIPSSQHSLYILMCLAPSSEPVGFKDCWSPLHGPTVLLECSEWLHDTWKTKKCKLLVSKQSFAILILSIFVPCCDDNKVLTCYTPLNKGTVQIYSSLHLRFLTISILPAADIALNNHSLDIRFDSEQIDELRASPSGAKTQVDRCCLK